MNFGKTGGPLLPTRGIGAIFHGAMKCPVCELFGRELRFETRRDLNQHASRFHGVTGAQLTDSQRHGYVARDEKGDALRPRRVLH